MSDFLLRLPHSLYRAEQVKQLDSLAIHSFAVPGFDLMQRAGAFAFHAIRSYWPHVRSLRVFAGSGNNGGDGFIVAALAMQAGLNCDVVLVGNTANLREDAAAALQLAQQAGASFQSLAEFEKTHLDASENSINVDALLGTGLDRAVTGDYATAIALLNTNAAPVVAIDVPSGLNGDTGQPMGCAVHADVTVSFIGIKQGMLTGQGRDFCGEILFTDLDLPDAVYQDKVAPQPTSFRFDINDANKHFMPRPRSSHKGSNGHVVIVGGERGYGGAIIMAGEAALRAGAGLVSVVTRSEHRSAILARCPELMVCGTEDSADSSRETDAWLQVDSLLDRATALVIGPGLGKGRWSQRLFTMALGVSKSKSIPMVIDADALHLLADRQSMTQAAKNMPWVLTPHPGEAAVLLASSSAEIQQDRFAALDQLVQQYQCTCLLKGSGTLIKAPNENAATLISEGNPGMGSGGMGDVLSGIIGSLLAQSMDCAQAAKVAAAIHGEAADLAAAEFGERGLKATDLLNFLRQLVNPTVSPKTN